MLLIVYNIFCVLLSFNQGTTFAESDKKFAQIVNDNVFFYNQDKSPLFIFPKTFYCELLKNVDENGYYYCKYINLYGFVKKDEIQCVSSSPDKPFLDYVNFRILGAQSAELRSEPSKQNGLNSLICSLDLYETNFIIYGNTQGEEIVPKRSDIWYYCEYCKDNKSYFGYVYSGLCDQVKDYEPLPIDTNTITEHLWQEELVPANAPTASENLTFVMPNDNQLIIIICISVPILLLLIFLFMPIKTGKHAQIHNKARKTETINTQPKSIKRIGKAEKGKDFYELN